MMLKDKETNYTIQLSNLEVDIIVDALNNYAPTQVKNFARENVLNYECVKGWLDNLHSGLLKIKV